MKFMYFIGIVNAILAIVLIYVLALVLRRKGTLTEDHSLTLTRIVTDLCLPAIIFVSLAKQTIRFLDVSGVLDYPANVSSYA